MAAKPGAVLTQHNDNGRTGANLQEKTLDVSHVNVNQFGKRFSHDVIGQIYAQPLVVPFVQIAGKGVHNAVFVVTMKNWVYAFDADDNAGDNARPLWGHQLQNKPSVPARVFRRGYRDVDGDIGILSTPAIDAQIGTSRRNPTTGTMYLVLFTRDARKSFHQLLYALDLAEGQPRPLPDGRPNPVEIAGSAPGSGYLTAQNPPRGSEGADHVVTFPGQIDDRPTPIVDGRDRRVEFNPMQQMQRPGLLLLNGVLYIAFGSHGDFDPYHGWVFAYDARTLERRGVFCSTPNGAKGGIWQAGEGLVADAARNVYGGTGNGDSKANGAGAPDLGETFFKIKLTSGGLALRGQLNAFKDPLGGDEDLGASSPTLLPGGRFVGGGKDGKFYLLDPAQMSPSGAAAALIQKFDASTGAGTRANVATRHIHGSPVVWDSPEHGPLVYVWGENDVLRAYRYDPNTKTFPGQPGPGGGQGAPVARGTTYASNDVKERDGMPGGMLSISADGKTPGTGIVWASFPPFDNANKQTVQGELIAYDASRFDAQGRLVAIWRSRQNPHRDDYGSFAKFCCPTIANGKVYQATFTNQLWVYGLLPTPDGGYNLGFGGTTGLTLNGSAKVDNTHIRLTDMHTFQAGSLFSTSLVNVGMFQTSFRFLLTHPDADGIAWVIQGEGPHALGGPGGGLGYGPDPNDPLDPGFRITRSVAVKFDLFDNQTLQPRSLTGLYRDGNSPNGGDIPLDAAGINLHSGHPFHVRMTYDGTTLAVTLRDETTRVEVTQNYRVDIPATTGPTAHVGFTGGTGGKMARQDILSWQFTS